MFLFFSLLFFLLFNDIITIFPNLKKEDFQTEIDGKKVDLYFLTNKNGYEISITNYGGTIVSIMAPNNLNQFENIVQGYTTLKDYITKENKNTILGPYANEIKNGEFILDNKIYKLNENDLSNLGQKIFTAVQINSKELRLFYTLEENENCFPGVLHIEIVYILNDNNELKISFTGITTKKTFVNLSQRLFFNLNGNTNEDINNQILKLNSKLYLPTDENKIPLGEIKFVDNTIYDYKSGKILGEKDIDEYFILDKKYSEKKENYSFCALLEDKISGRKMEIYTTEPGFHIFKNKKGISIEAMHFPNSPNMGFFPSTLLKPGNLYQQETVYRFNAN
jgi:aldose 1-epimerase